MNIELTISIIGAVTAVIVSIISALFTKRNSQILQIRQLKEDHYIAYIEALHNLATDNKDSKLIQKYTFYRDKLLIIASEDVVRAKLLFEEEAVGKYSDLHDKYLTDLIKAIRFDLKLKDSNFPLIFFKK